MSADRTSSPENQDVKSAAAIMHELRWRQRVLLAGGNENTQSLRASLLRAHGLEVDVARSLADSRRLWQRSTYDWIFVDVYSHLPGEVMDFCEQLRHTAPRQRIAFFVGPPAYRPCHAGTGWAIIPLNSMLQQFSGISACEAPAPLF